MTKVLVLTMSARVRRRPRGYRSRALASGRHRLTGLGAQRPNEMIDVMSIADGGPLAVEPNEAEPAQRVPARG